MEREAILQAHSYMYAIDYMYGLCCPVPEGCGESGLYIVPPMLPQPDLAVEQWTLDYTTDRQLQFTFIHADDDFEGSNRERRRSVAVPKDRQIRNALIRLLRNN